MTRSRRRARHWRKAPAVGAAFRRGTHIDRNCRAAAKSLETGFEKHGRRLNLDPVGIECVITWAGVHDALPAEAQLI